MTVEAPSPAEALPPAPLAPPPLRPPPGERVGARVGGWATEPVADLTVERRSVTTLADPDPEPALDIEDLQVRADDVLPGHASRSSLRNGVEWVVIIGAALLAALLIKTFLLQAFYIPSPSMVPTLHVDDRVLVNKLSYRLHDVHRGDVVVFERPPNDAGVIRDLIKRVVGLPGETVEGRDGGVYVNGRRLAEPYLPEGTITSTFGPQRIPPGRVWVMGDNRSNSSDSRVFGPVPESRIVGRAFVRVWPLSAFGPL